ncbi:MAG TPA: hypothetical protein VGD60_11465 [Candidatus Acidoferrales bacterium]
MEVTESISTAEVLVNPVKPKRTSKNWMADKRARDKVKAEKAAEQRAKREVKQAAVLTENELNFVDASEADLPIRNSAGFSYVYGECHPLEGANGLRHLFNEEVRSDPNSGYTLIGDWLRDRQQAREDFLFLGRDLLGKNFVVGGPEGTGHDQIIASFVIKDLKGKFYHGYTLQDIHDWIGELRRGDGPDITDEDRDCKDSLVLTSRGSYKSTADACDIVSWIIAVSDIRWLLVTATKKLSSSFLKEIKQFFGQADGAERTRFQHLYPDYIIRGIDITSEQPYLAPCRILVNQKEPTLWNSSAESSTSGFHADGMSVDDPVDEQNSLTEDTRQSLKERLDLLDPLIDAWGWKQYFGTRYHPEDYWSTLLEMKKETPLRYVHQAAFEVRTEFLKVPLRELTEEMVDLTFPTILPWRVLKQRITKSESLFRNQYLNIPIPAEERITFDLDILKEHVFSPGAEPKAGEIIIAMDAAHSSGQRADETAICAIRIIETPGQLPAVLVLEIDHGHFKPSEICFHLVAMAKRYQPKKIFIEKTAGSELLQLEISRTAAVHAVSLPIFWAPVDTTKDAKQNRVRNLELLLESGRLAFVKSAEPGWNDALFTQLIRFTSSKNNRNRKDDLCDALAQACRFLPMTATAEQIKDEEEEALKKRTMRDMYDRVFGSSVPSRQSKAAEQDSGPTRFGNTVLPRGFRTTQIPRH